MSGLLVRCGTIGVYYGHGLEVESEISDLREQAMELALVGDLTD
jgi:hypothetical protein